MTDHQPSSRLDFTLEATATGSSARACRFKTLHNEVQTPVFMPVATFAALRNQPVSQIESLDFPVLLANTYHLLLRPGPEVFRRMGGIQKFMNWKNSVLTDSGGFQIFSLSQSFSISEEGAAFKSYVDGREYLLSPELSIETQKAIGSDIMMVLDQCIASTSDHQACISAMDLTARWAERSLAARKESLQGMFGIIQGGCFPDLRKISASQITSLPFDGYAIGGLAVGESEDERKDITELTAALMPANRPRYLMGVGTPIDLLEAVHRGVDMFDCIIPTSLAQQGVAYTSKGRIELRRTVHKFSDQPLDEACHCAACRHYSRAYLHHLVKTKEFLGHHLIGLHNLTFYKNLMTQMREHILGDTFLSFYKEQRELLTKVDEENPKIPAKPVRRKSPPTLGDYEILEKVGFNTIRQKSSGEIMHSVSDPMVESRTLYYEQSGLKEALERKAEDANLHYYTIWDVGLGAATNAMITLMEFEKLIANTSSQIKLRIISFENDLDAMRLVIKKATHFPHIQHGAPSTLLKEGQWISKDGRIEWLLLEGDFKETALKAPTPDCIYFDLFSCKTDAPSWTYDVFARLYNLCKSKNTRILTYSASTHVRSSLLAAGFHVGTGPATGPKSGTTVAFSSVDASSGFPLLGTEWLERFKRSDAKTSPGASPSEQIEIINKVMNHPQFQIKD